MLEKRPLLQLRKLGLFFLFGCSFIDHLAVMFGEELPPWDTDRKYLPQNLQVCDIRLVGCVPGRSHYEKGISNNQPNHIIWLSYELCYQCKILKTDLRMLIQLSWYKMYTSVFIFLQLFFEDEEMEVLYQVVPDMSLLKVLQHKRYWFCSYSSSNDHAPNDHEYFTDNSTRFATYRLYILICFNYFFVLILTDFL